MKFISFVIIYIFISINIHSQNLIFDHLSVSDGLSQYTALDIYQDEYNRMWIATRDGLNKYEGSHIEVFKTKANDTTSLFTNEINNVTGNKKGLLFIRAVTGLVVYDLMKQSFKTVSKKGINCLYYGKDRLWVGTKNEIKTLDENSLTLSNYKTLDAKLNIRSILEASNGSLYIGTESSLTLLLPNGNIKELLSDILVVCLYQDSDNQIWVGSQDNGLYCICLDGSIIHYTYTPNNKDGLSSPYIRAICQDNQGNYWIGTYNGLDYFNQKTGEFKNYTHITYDTNSISDQSIWCITKDKQGSLWIGTFFGGVNIINPEFSFSRFYPFMGNEGKPHENFVNNVTEDAKGNLWICSDNAGLSYFDVTKDTFTHYRYSSTNTRSLSSDNLKASCLDRDNNALWIGSHLGGLDRLDLTTQEISRVKLPTNNPRIYNHIRNIIKYKDLLLLGTQDLIYTYNPVTGELKSLIEHRAAIGATIWDMIVDSKERLWFFTGGEVYCYNLRTKKMQTFDSLKSMNLATFHEDHNHRIWIGSSGNGIFVYNEDVNEFRHYHTLNSNIIDDSVLDIEETLTGNIIVATNQGVSLYNPKEDVFYNYYNNVFFPFESLNERCLYVTKAGDIVLSSLNGLMIISETDLQVKFKPDIINLTNLYINNKKISPLDETGLLKQSIVATDTIYLQESHSVINIEFSATNYLKSLQPNIQYKLEGFDKEWVDAKNNNNSVTYTNLYAGTYKLMIRGAERFGQEDEPKRELLIIIEPHWYKTWYAYLLYALILMGIFYLIVARILLQDSLKYAKDKAAQIEEVNQSKMRFFINVSHEIRTPVTLIIAQLDFLLQSSKDIPASINNRLLNIKRNTSKLKELINELLDFKKQEEEHVLFKMTEQNIVPYLRNVFMSFNEYATSLQINTSFVCNEDKVMVYYNAVQMDKVIYNLLSNAFKYTPPKENVSMLIEKTDNSVEISVIDTGVGINKEYVDKIFNRFYQIQNEDFSIQPVSQGIGIGLALVKNIVDLHHGKIDVSDNGNRGTILKVILPLGYEHLTEAEIGSHSYNESQDAAISKKIDILATHSTNREEDTDDDKKYTAIVVEDEDDLRNILVNILSPTYKVHAYPSGVKLLDDILEIKPHIILIDVMLPNISGIELCAKIKSNLQMLHIPVILLTAAATSAKRIEGLNVGADDYITKPFDINELITRCHNLVNIRTSLRNIYAKTGKEESKQALTGITPKDREFVDKVLQIAKENLGNPEFNIDNLAQTVGMGRGSLFVKLKELTGQAPSSFISNIRLEESRELLKDKNIPIKEIAYIVGYNDVSYFIKIFKSHYGVTPLQYRRNI